MLTQSRIDAATAGFRAVFMKAYEGAAPEWKDLAFLVPSSSKSETYEFITSMPEVKQLTGEAKVEQFASAGFVVVNQEWEATVEVPIADIERDALGLYGPQFTEMADQARMHPQELVAELLNNGFTATDYTGTAFFADSKKFNPDDKSKGAATFDNKGTAALSLASLGAGIQSIKERKNAKGKSLRLGRKLVLVVPPALEITARKLLTAELLQSADGNASETNVLRNSFTLVVLPELTSATAWFLLEGGRAIKPLVVQMEKEPEFIAADNPTDAAIVKSKKFLYQSYGRYNAGYALPQLAYGSTGAA